MTIQTGTAALRRVYVRPPGAGAATGWRASGWHEAPDPARAADEHAAFRALLEGAGAEVVSGRPPEPEHPDAIYAYDPALLTDRGVILLRPGKPGRRGEPREVADDLLAAGLDVVGEMTAPGVAEGGDMFWLDPSTLLVGLGYRTNAEGADQIRSLLPEVEVLTFDLPHHLGPDRCLHLMSAISPLDDDLAVVFPPILPARLLGLLGDRGVRTVEVPPEEFDTMGPNVLALGPRVGLALAGNPETRRRLGAAGVEVLTYEGGEISRKGDGGPTCLTRPLARGGRG